MEAYRKTAPGGQTSQHRIVNHKRYVLLSAAPRNGLDAWKASYNISDGACIAGPSLNTVEFSNKAG